jgi:hypothetical protein
MALTTISDADRAYALVVGAVRGYFRRSPAARVATAHELLQAIAEVMTQGPVRSRPEQWRMLEWFAAASSLGVALVTTAPWPRGPHRRPSERETWALGRAFCDGDFLGERRVARKLAPWLPAHQQRLFVSDGATPYSTIRDYLMDEHDADPRIAARVALHLTSTGIHS